MGMIIIGYFSLCICVCFFKRLSLLLLGVGFAYDWYAFFIAHHRGRAILLLLLLCLAVTLYRVARGEDLSDHQKKEIESPLPRRAQKSSMNWILYVIPIFWPFIIVRLFFGGKTVATDMSPFDYEQHLKSNAR